MYKYPGCTTRRPGREQLGGHVQGTSTWVGTTEAAVVFRMFGIRAQIVDFMGGRNGAGCRHPTSATTAHMGA